MFSRTPAAGILLTLTVGLTAGCGQASPIQPAAPSPSAADPAASPGIVFALDAGTLTLESPNGSLSGDFIGEATAVGNDVTAVTTVVVTGGTGQYAGAAGTLTGTGSGAFVGEGGFSLLLQGSILTGRGSRPFRASVRGTSALGCRDGTIVVLQSGSGTAAALGRISAQMRYDIASNAGCEAE